MIRVTDFEKISEFEWEIPLSFNPDLKIPVRAFVSRDLLEEALGDLSFDQAINAAMLPGFIKNVLIMPDVHQGYGFPIGGVAAADVESGMISPGAIGYDINCGVRLLGSSILLEEAEPYLDDLILALDRHCPSGVGTKGSIKLNEKELSRVLETGAKWAEKQGFASEVDLRRTENGGSLPGIWGKVSARARERGEMQLGTLGAGNHFLEVGVVDRIINPSAASTWGLTEGCLTLMIHCGSRGLGHQVCTDYVKSFQGLDKRYGIKLPDRELVCAPINSPEGQDYVGAMRAAANYAFANRQILAHRARMAFEEVLAGKVANWHLFQVYDIAHNMGNFETHSIDGKPRKLCVHRKGATRALPPNSPDLPEEYRSTGQPVLIPGTMGTASWILSGTHTGMKKSFGTTCHGAGRMMSRNEAKRKVRGSDLIESLGARGIRIRAGSLSGLAEEAPEAYKDVDRVVDTVCGAGIASKVARLLPVAVIKG